MKPKWECTVWRDGNAYRANHDDHSEVFYGVRCFPNHTAAVACISFGLGCAFFATMMLFKGLL